MRPLILFTTLFTVSFYGCSDKATTTKSQPAFKSFEISYTNGWTKGFSFIVDTNRIYFAPQKWNTSYYGILPDSIIKLLDTAFLQISSNKNIKSKDEGCVDCPIVGIKIIAKNDTTRIIQNGQLDELFYPLIQSMQEFIAHGSHETIKAEIWLETQQVSSPLPPKIEEKSYKPPIKR